MDELLTDDPRAAARLLAVGGLVGLPTETVYGLAAVADDPRAVARVYATKGRPADHPLIVHVRGLQDVAAWARHVPPYAVALARAVWPGPLTLVLPRGPRAGDHVTGGQDTVGLRAPAHPLALEVLEHLAPLSAGGVPGLAAPSANRFGRVSPTRADDVVAELAGRLRPGTDAVLDGGPSGVGVESTILDCTGDAPVLLRPGAVTADDVAALGGVPLAQGVRSSVRAPGTLAAHYAPRARVVLVGSPDDVPALLAGAGEATAGLLALAATPTPDGVVRLSAPDDVPAYARGLYRALREADALGLDLVVAVPPPGGGLGAAVVDRLRRAAASS